ncbi:MAG: CHAT domain-containing protein [Planctomycetes bacterium]|nr:CHAT domain-containing protein [Planctomycetota bacterium]
MSSASPGDPIAAEAVAAGPASSPAHRPDSPARGPVRLFVAVAVLLAAACSREAAQPVAVHPLRVAIATLAASTTNDARREALAVLERTAEATWTDARATDVAPWIEAIGTLESWERGGWSLREPALARAIRVRASLANAGAGATANAFEAAITVWLLRRRTERGPGPFGGDDLDDVVRRLDIARWVSAGDGDHAWTLILCAVLERDAGREDRALSLLAAADRALALQSGTTEPDRCFVALERASCFQNLGRHADAARILREASRLAEASQPVDVAGRARQRRDRHTTALALVRQASDAGLHSRVLDDAAKLRAAEPDADLGAQLPFYEAVALRALGRSDDARHELDLALADESLDPKSRAMAWLERAAVALDAGEFDTVLRALDEHRSLVARAGDGAWPMQTARAIALRAGLDRRRSTDAAGLTTARDRARSAYRAFLASCRPPDDGLGTGILAFAPRRLLIDELIELTLRVDSTESGVVAALDDVLAAHAIGSLAKSLDAPAPTVTAVRDRLLTRDGDGLLVLVPGAAATHAFALDRRRVVHARLAPVEALESALRALWRELAAPPRDASNVARARFDAAAGDVARALFPAPVAERLRTWRRVFVTGTEVVQRIPLDVLPLPGAGVLGIERDVVALPSCAVGLALAARAAEPTATAGTPTRSLLALVAPPPVPGADEPAVRFADIARERILKQWPATRWLTGRAAHLDSLADATPSALLVFAHGDFDPLRGRPRGVLLAPCQSAPDGRLFPDILESSGVRVPWFVLLGACHASGTDPKLGGDDADHLGASLLRCGARLVLIAASPLEQDATAQLAAAALESVASDGDPSQALRRARVSLRADARFDHPHAWGTWVAYGWWP